MLVQLSYASVTRKQARQPRRESHPVHDLRTVACNLIHFEAIVFIKMSTLGWNRTTIAGSVDLGPIY